MFENPFAGHGDTDGSPDLRKTVLELPGEGARCPEVLLHMIGEMPLFEDLIDRRGILMEPVVAELMKDPDGDQNKGRNAQSQSRDGDDGIDFMPFEASKGGGDVVFQHGGIISSKVESLTSPK